MAQVTYPGVYVEEVPSGVRPIAAVSTSVAGLIGVAEKGPLNETVKVFNFTEYQNRYGGFLAHAFLSHAVFQFFNNGGTQCYVVRVAGANAASGIVLWGARTITADPEWTYIPVRRMAIFLRVSLYRGIQWAVFEPNDDDLWTSLRLNINSFMMNLFRQGVFHGATPSQAFFVKCDNETTTQDDINLGIVNILVGFAPLKPAEFVVVKISQKAGQPA